MSGLLKKTSCFFLFLLLFSSQKVDLKAGFGLQVKSSLVLMILLLLIILFLIIILTIILMKTLSKKNILKQNNLLIRNLQEGFVAIDKQGFIQYANPALALLFNQKEKANLSGKKLSDYFCSDDEDLLPLILTLSGEKSPDLKKGLELRLQSEKNESWILLRHLSRIDDISLKYYLLNDISLYKWEKQRFEYEKELVRIINFVQEIDQLYKNIIIHSTSLPRIDAAAFFTFNSDDQLLLEFSLNLPYQENQVFTKKDNQILIDILEKNRVVFIDAKFLKFRADKGFGKWKEISRSLMVVPICQRRLKIGCFVLASFSFDFLPRQYQSVLEDTAGHVSSAMLRLITERQLEQYTAQLQDLTHRLENKNQELENLSNTDELTGLFNRRYFNYIFAREFERSQRYKQPLSCFMIDIDHFKRINDNHGHPFGDFILMEIAAILKEHSRSTDYCARYGGEEFVVISPIERSAARNFAERLMGTIRPHHFIYKNKECRITISIGISTLQEPFANKEDFLNAADQALYQAKNEGRNKMVMYGPAF